MTSKSQYERHRASNIHVKRADEQVEKPTASSSQSWQRPPGAPAHTQSHSHSSSASILSPDKVKSNCPSSSAAWLFHNHSEKKNLQKHPKPPTPPSRLSELLSKFIQILQILIQTSLSKLHPNCCPKVGLQLSIQVPQQPPLCLQESLCRVPLCTLPHSYFLSVALIKGNLLHVAL